MYCLATMQMDRQMTSLCQQSIVLLQCSMIANDCESVISRNETERIKTK